MAQGLTDAEVFGTVENPPAQGTTQLNRGMSDDEVFGDKHVDMSKTRAYFDQNLAKAKGEHPYEGMTLSVAQQMNKDPEFHKLVIGILKSESSKKDPLKTSPAGARGPMQIMPATFAAYNPKGNIDDPAESIPAAVAHLNELWQKYHGDKAKIAAAYNAGEPTMLSGELPDETKAYVPKVLKNSAEADVRPWNILPPGMPNKDALPPQTSALTPAQGPKKDRKSVV